MLSRVSFAKCKIYNIQAYIGTLPDSSAKRGCMQHETRLLATALRSVNMKLQAAASLETAAWVSWIGKVLFRATCCMEFVQSQQKAYSRDT